MPVWANTGAADRSAEIDLRRGREAVCPLPQIYLVHVQLEDLVFAEAVLDLEGQHCLVELARECPFRRQKEVPGHLHRDRARSLPAAAGREVGVGRTQHADVVNAGMLVEALVLGSQDRAFQNLGHLPD